MRKQVDVIELTHDEVIDINRYVYEANASLDLFITATNNKDIKFINDDFLNGMYEKAIEKQIALSFKKDEITRTKIPDKYKNIKYQWEIDNQRDILIIYEVSEDEE